MTVALPTRKIWRTSARPSTTSTISGSSMPLRAASHVLGELVDDVVEADVDALGSRRPGGRSRSIFVLKPTTIAFDADASRMSLSVMSPVPSRRTLMRDLVRPELLQRVGDRTQRALHVGLEDDPQLLGLAGLDLAVEVLERGATGAGAVASGLLGLARLDHGAGGLLVGDDAQDVACLGHVREAEDHDGRAGPALGTRLPAAFSRARTLPYVSPTTTTSPTCSVPVWTISVATGPRPLSSSASMTVPTAAASGWP